MELCWQKLMSDVGESSLRTAVNYFILSDILVFKWKNMVELRMSPKCSQPERLDRERCGFSASLIIEIHGM